jgi:ribosomal protein S18 acetylase RimI-like enzyme
MIIKEINRFNMRVFTAVSGLLPQLDPDSKALTFVQFRKILGSEGTHLFIAEHETRIIGMMTIVTYHVPVGTKFWIEDLVVDESQRGMGFGKEMISFAIGFARSKGAKSIDLTSRPFRVAANKLYRDAGFDLRETNVYRFALK